MKRIVVQKIFKKIKVPVEHCSVCKQQLGGHGSSMFPWTCNCGVWQYDWIRGEHFVYDTNK